MQDILIQRYLGNKSVLTSEIVDLVNDLASPGDLIFDAFSGSLAVSAALRAAGFRVACNDINHFSWSFARAFFTSSDLPSIDGVLPNQIPAAWDALIEELTSPYEASFPVDARRTDIFDHYCEDGERSSFVSKRGWEGRRRFFSAENGVLIDRALSRIRYYSLSGRFDEQVRCILTACLSNAVEKISNTQGTFHDFPRDFVDQRSLKRLRIRPPEVEYFKGPISEHIGRAEDSLEFARSVPRHRVLYLDPPYNFRQYTSYYFMLNLFSRYPEIQDLDGFFRKIEFVRGQNMEDDFKSTFCVKDKFIPSLKSLIERSDCEYVVMSYFDGRNHWGQFKSEEADTVGKTLLEEFFCGDTFVSGSFNCVPVARTNYQSYGGHTAKAVQEFLFVARKAMRSEVSNNLRGHKWTGLNVA